MNESSHNIPPQAKFYQLVFQLLDNSAFKQAEQPRFFSWPTLPADRALLLNTQNVHGLATKYP